MTPEAERRLREAILDRVADYKMWGLVVTGIVTRLNEDGPLQTLEHYAMLLQRIDQPHDPPFTVLQRARLISRESVAAPPGAGGP